MMENSQVKENIQDIKKEINEVFKFASDNREKELINMIKRLDVRKAVARDKQLQIFEQVCRISAVEMAYRNITSILKLVDNLDMLEELFLNVLYYCRRFEYLEMPVEELDEGVCFFAENNISGVALFSFVEIGTVKKEDNLIRIAQFLKREGQLIRAVLMLQLAVSKYEKNEDILMELADCWLVAKQWKKAYDVLKRIEKPSKEIKEIIVSLEEVLEDESIK